MTTLEAYQIYLAVRLHFTNKKYDITHTKGRVRVVPGQLENKPRMKYSLEKMSVRFPRKKFINFLVASFARGENPLFSPNAETNYQQFVKYMEGMSYFYERDLRQLQTSCDCTEVEALWSGENHPVILKEYLGGRIHLETLIILDRLFKFSTILNERLSGDAVWEPLYEVMYKYLLFIKFDEDKVRMITRKVFA
jgi:hypothetical protein